jgi:outer membrane protein assembly factor BamB
LTGVPLLLLPAALLVVRPAAATEGWPGFRGRGDGHVADRELPLEWSESKNLAWRVELPGYGQSSPVVWNGTIFTTSVLGANKETLVVEAISLASGNLLWEKHLPASERREYTKTQSRAAPTPVVDDRGLFVFFESGDVFALDHRGNVLWQRKLVAEYGPFQGAHGVGSSLAQTRDLIYVLVQHGGPSYLLAVEKSSGATRFKLDRPEKTAWTTPIVAPRRGRDEVLISANGTVASVDAATGATIWYVSGIEKNLIASPSATEETVIVGSSEKAGSIAIARDGSGDVSRSHVLWTAEAAADYASPLVTGRCVYFINPTGGLTCVDPASGRARWKHRLPGPAWASPFVRGNHVYVFTKSGITEVFEDRAEEPVVLATSSLPVEAEDDALYGVAVSESSILMRTAARLYCVRSAATGASPE